MFIYTCLLPKNHSASLTKFFPIENHTLNYVATNVFFEFSKAPYSTSGYRKARLSENRTENGKAIAGSTDAFLCIRPQNF